MSDPESAWSAKWSAQCAVTRLPVLGCRCGDCATARAKPPGHYVDLGSPELNALRDARREAGDAESITDLDRWFQLDQAVRAYLVSVRS